MLYYGKNNDFYSKLQKSHSGWGFTHIITWMALPVSSSCWALNPNPLDVVNFRCNSLRNMP